VVSTSSSHGLLDSVRQIGENLLGTVHDRLELFSLELQEEKFRVIRMLILANAAIFSGFLALIFISLTVTYLFWEHARIWVLGGFAFFYTAIFVGLALAVLRGAHRETAPFGSSRREIASDRDAFRRGG
jgi:uncharacterized membrane protein YqjE